MAGVQTEMRRLDCSVPHKITTRTRECTCQDKFLPVRTRQAAIVLNNPAWQRLLEAVNGRLRVEEKS